MPEHTTENAGIAISAQDLCIKYRLYKRKHFTLKEAALNLFRGYQYESFWALQDLTFELKPGESLGVVGPNGAGKSTLLKAIAHVLPPSKGTLTVNGRVAPLIELGGGFNPELTGRENIFLNGAIMGRSRREMNEKVQHIIDFAEINEFIDAPLQTYSSGMKSRLGFAIATDIDPEILLLDEIFAVGDESFQAKAAARTRSFFEGDKTVIVVSHNLDLVERLCTRAIYLTKGRVVQDGPPAEVIESYRRDVKEKKN